MPISHPRFLGLALTLLMIDWRLSSKAAVRFRDRSTNPVTSRLGTFVRRQQPVP
jgi:hypothetical protein